LRQVTFEFELAANHPVINIGMTGHALLADDIGNADMLCILMAFETLFTDAHCTMGSIYST